FIHLLPTPPHPTPLPYTTLFRSGNLYTQDELGGASGPLSANECSRPGSLAERVRVRSPSFHRHSGRGVANCGNCDAGGTQASNRDRKSTRLNSSHLGISYAVFCL